MTIDQLEIYRNKIRSVSVPEAVNFLLSEIDMKSNQLTAADEQNNVYLKTRQIACDELMKCRSQLFAANDKLSIAREALEEIERLGSTKNVEGWVIGNHYAATAGIALKKMKQKGETNE
jgi:hypothetical protein